MMTEREVVYFNITWVSRKGHQQLLRKKERLERLIEERKLELGRVASEDGDLPENLRFKELRVELMFVLPRQLRELNQLIGGSRVIEDSDDYKNADPSRVFIGSRVTVDISGGGKKVFSILGPPESDVEKGIISYKSPLGQALLGEMIGGAVKFGTPDGEQFVEILGIEKALE